MVPQDYTRAAFNPMSVTYNFSIFLEPCIVSNLSATLISKVEYMIGADSLTSQQYEFIQAPQCNYNLNYTVTGLMPFFNH